MHRGLSVAEHIWQGRCPDSIVGPDARDPECPACDRLPEPDQLALLVRQRCEWWDRHHPTAMAFEVTGDIRSILERYDSG